MEETEIFIKEADPRVTPAEFKQARLPTSSNKKWKGLFVVLFLLVCLISILLLRKSNLQLIIVEGQGLGRDYKIQYRVAGNINYQEEVDKLLAELDDTVNGSV